MNSIIKVIFISSLVALFSCTNEEDEKKFSLSGIIKNATENNVSNATIALTGDKAYTGISDTDGNYSISNIVEGTYTVTASKTGYEDTLYSLTINKNLADYNFTIIGAAQLTGAVTNSQNGYSLDSANVKFAFSDANPRSTQSGAIEFEGITNEDGEYTIANAPVGIFTCLIEKPGFYTRTFEIIEINEGLNEIEQSVLLEAPEQRSLRIILSWGESPSDLDSHLTGPDGMGGRFHMYYMNKTPIESILLDVDETSSYGLETTKIISFTEGTYRYSVFNYSDQGTTGGDEIAFSPAIVKIYDHSGLIQTFNAPSFPVDGGNTWCVFEIEATNQDITIVPINTYVQANDDCTNDMKQNGKKAKMSITNF